jgi:peptidoglycan/LPS O-acetylase OafA/YrhL
MIPGLDGLRAVAILVVFFFHSEMFEFGWVGVQLFFVISGFLITDILLNMKEKFAPRDYFIKFYGRRFLRIFPLYYFYLALMAGITTWLATVGFRPKAMQVFWDQLLFALTYIYDLFHGTEFFVHTNFLTHFWSLSVEEQFYFVWPLVLLLTPKQHYKRLFLGAILLGPVLRILLTLIYRGQLIPHLLDDMPLAIYILPFSHVDAFGFGAYIARFELPKAKWQFFTLATIIPLVGFASEVIFTSKPGAWSALGYPAPLANGWKQVWGYSLLNYFFAVVIYCVAREGMFTRILEFLPIRYLGKISYGMYVYHFPVIWFVQNGSRALGWDSLLPYTVWISLAAIVAISSLSYHLFEKPILDLKDRFFATNHKRVLSGVTVT